ncbi:MAG: UbiA family prenyltransferase, partial [Candidatus Aminicenantales bacterium]
MGPLRQYLALCRPGVSLLAACSALAGCLLAPEGVSARFLVPWAGVLVLACGAGALNQVQERETDARMERTKGRPIPTGRIAPARALAFSLLLLLLGMSILAAGGRTAVFLGVLAVAWYNGVYTRLKAISAFAAIPGALTGAFPPAIGWACGGGSLADFRLYALCLILFAWQVPHFWLVVMDRGREYREAGLPGLTEFFTGVQIRRLVSFWILGTAACSLLLSLGSLVR